MANDPWTGARLGQQSDAPTGGLFLAEVVTELGPSSCPSFANAAARDTAFANWQAAGNTPVAGMRSYTDDNQWYWSYRAGAWRKVGGPPALVASAVNIYGGGQAINGGGYTGLCSVLVPGGSAGTLLCRFHGGWVAASNAACLAQLYIGPGASIAGADVVPGSQTRSHNNSVANVSNRIDCWGYTPWDGNQKYVTLALSADVAGVSVQLNAASFHVWLV